MPPERRRPLKSMTIARGSMAGGLEEPAHEVLATHEGFEVRRYAPNEARASECRG